MTLAQVIGALRMTIEKVDFNPYTFSSPPGALNYVASVTSGGKTVKFYHMTGPGVDIPKVSDIVDARIDDIKEMLIPFDSKNKRWEDKFLRNATETRATQFAELIGDELFGIVLKHIGVP